MCRRPASVSRKFLCGNYRNFAFWFHFRSAFVGTSHPHPRCTCAKCPRNWCQSHSPSPSPLPSLPSVSSWRRPCTDKFPCISASELRNCRTAGLHTWVLICVARRCRVHLSHIRRHFDNNFISGLQFVRTWVEWLTIPKNNSEVFTIRSATNRKFTKISQRLNREGKE